MRWFGPSGIRSAAQKRNNSYLAMQWIHFSTSWHKVGLTMPGRIDFQVAKGRLCHWHRCFSHILTKKISWTFFCFSLSLHGLIKQVGVFCRSRSNSYGFRRLPRAIHFSKSMRVSMLQVFWDWLEDSSNLGCLFGSCFLIALFTHWPLVLVCDYSDGIFAEIYAPLN